jgi:excisionase family DNA binding protein
MTRSEFRDNARPLLTARQAARAAGVSASTFYRWLELGVLPDSAAIRIPGCEIKIRAAVLVAWLEGQADKTAFDNKPAPLRVAAMK